MLGSSQSSASLANSTRVGTRNHYNPTDTRRKSLQSQGFTAHAKLGMGPASGGKATGTGLWNQRPSNVTDQRSTAVHSGMGSPSTAMFKMSSFNSRVTGMQGTRGHNQPANQQSGAQ